MKRPRVDSARGDVRFLTCGNNVKGNVTMTIEVKKVTKVSRSRKLPKVIGAISLFAAFSFSGTSALAIEGPGDLGDRKSVV